MNFTPEFKAALVDALAKLDTVVAELPQLDAQDVSFPSATVTVDDIEASSAHISFARDTLRSIVGARNNLSDFLATLG